MAQTQPSIALFIIIPIIEGQYSAGDSLPHGLYYVQKLPDGHLSNEVYGYLFPESKLLQVDIHTGFVRTWAENEDGDLEVEGEKFISTPVRVVNTATWKILHPGQSHLAAFLQGLAEQH